MKLQETTNAARRFCLCSSEAVKVITTQEGYFPDFGHHQDHEMGGVWLHPIKLFDGFWLRFRDQGTNHTDTWVAADTCRVAPWGVEQSGGGYGSTLGNTAIRTVPSTCCAACSPPSAWRVRPAFRRCPRTTAALCRRGRYTPPSCRSCAISSACSRTRTSDGL